MRAKILKIQNNPSYQGGDFFYIFFKSLDDNKSYRSCISRRFGNFQKWRCIRTGDILDNLKLKKGLVDADSNFKIIAHEHNENETEIK